MSRFNPERPDLVVRARSERLNTLLELRTTRNGGRSSVDLVAPDVTMEQLLPHRGSMLLLERLVERRSNGAVSVAVPSRLWPFADDLGVPATVGLEVMAQGVGVHVGLQKLENRERVRMGLLLGTRQYRCTVSHFPFGQPLTVTAALELSTDAGMAAFSCQIELDGRVIAEATLNLYQPPDVEALLGSP